MLSNIMPPSEIYVKNTYYFQRKGRKIARRTASRRPALSAKREAPSGNNLSQSKSSEEKEEARDLSPDVEARQDCWSIMEGCSKDQTQVPKDDVPTFLNYIDVRRHENEYRCT